MKELGDALNREFGLTPEEAAAKPEKLSAQMLTLPEPARPIGLSDHRNYWARGWQAGDSSPDPRRLREQCFGTLAAAPFSITEHYASGDRRAATTERLSWSASHGAADGFCLGQKPTTVTRPLDLRHRATRDTATPHF